MVGIFLEDGSGFMACRKHDFSDLGFILRIIPLVDELRNTKWQKKWQIQDKPLYASITFNHLNTGHSPEKCSIIVLGKL